MQPKISAVPRNYYVVQYSQRPLFIAALCQDPELLRISVSGLVMQASVVQHETLEISYKNFKKQQGNEHDVCPTLQVPAV